MFDSKLSINFPLPASREAPSSTIVPTKYVNSSIILLLYHIIPSSLT